MNRSFDRGQIRDNNFQQGSRGQHSYYSAESPQRQYDAGEVRLYNVQASQSKDPWEWSIDDTNNGNSGSHLNRNTSIQTSNSDNSQPNKGFEYNTWTQTKLPGNDAAFNLHHQPHSNYGQANKSTPVYQENIKYEQKPKWEPTSQNMGINLPQTHLVSNQMSSVASSSQPMKESYYQSNTPNPFFTQPQDQQVNPNVSWSNQNSSWNADKPQWAPQHQYERSNEQQNQYQYPSADKSTWNPPKEQLPNVSPVRKQESSWDNPQQTWKLSNESTNPPSQQQNAYLATQQNNPPEWNIPSQPIEQNLSESTSAAYHQESWYSQNQAFPSQPNVNLSETKNEPPLSKSSYEYNAKQQSASGRLDHQSVLDTFNEVDNYQQPQNTGSQEYSSTLNITNQDANYEQPKNSATMEHHSNEVGNFEQTINSGGPEHHAGTQITTYEQPSGGLGHQSMVNADSGTVNNEQHLSSHKSMPQNFSGYTDKPYSIQQEPPRTTSFPPTSQYEPPRATSFPPPSQQESPKIAFPPTSQQEPPKLTSFLPTSSQESPRTTSFPPTSQQESSRTTPYPPTSQYEPLRTTSFPLNSQQGSPQTNNFPPTSQYEPPRTTSFPPASQQESPQTTSFPPTSQYEPPRTTSFPPASQQESPQTTNFPPTPQQEPPKITSFPPTSQQEPPKTASFPPTSQYESPQTTNFPPTSQQELPKTTYLPPTSQQQPPRAASFPPAFQHQPSRSASLPPTSQQHFHQQMESDLQNVASRDVYQIEKQQPKDEFKADTHNFNNLASKNFNIMENKEINISFPENDQLLKSGVQEDCYNQEVFNGESAKSNIASTPDTNDLPMENAEKMDVINKDNVSAPNNLSSTTYYQKDVEPEGMKAAVGSQHLLEQVPGASLDDSPNQEVPLSSTTQSSGEYRPIGVPAVHAKVKQIPNVSQIIDSEVNLEMVPENLEKPPDPELSAKSGSLRNLNRQHVAASSQNVSLLDPIMDLPAITFMPTLIAAQPPSLNSHSDSVPVSNAEGPDFKAMEYNEKHGKGTSNNLQKEKNEMSEELLQNLQSLDIKNACQNVSETVQDFAKKDTEQSKKPFYEPRNDQVDFQRMNKVSSVEVSASENVVPIENKGNLNSTEVKRFSGEDAHGFSIGEPKMDFAIQNNSENEPKEVLHPEEPKIYQPQIMPSQNTLDDQEYQSEETFGTSRKIIQENSSKYQEEFEGPPKRPISMENMNKYSYDEPQEKDLRNELESEVYIPSYDQQQYREPHDSKSFTDPRREDSQEDRHYTDRYPEGERRMAEERRHSYEDNSQYHRQEDHGKRNTAFKETRRDSYDSLHSSRLDRSHEPEREANTLPRARKGHFDKSKMNYDDYKDESDMDVSRHDYEEDYSHRPRGDPRAAYDDPSHYHPRANKHGPRSVELTPSKDKRRYKPNYDEYYNDELSRPSSRASIDERYHRNSQFRSATPSMMSETDRPDLYDNRGNYDNSSGRYRQDYYPQNPYREGYGYPNYYPQMDRHNYYQPSYYADQYGRSYPYDYYGRSGGYDATYAHQPYYGAYYQGNYPEYETQRSDSRPHSTNEDFSKEETSKYSHDIEQSSLVESEVSLPSLQSDSLYLPHHLESTQEVEPADSVVKKYNALHAIARFTPNGQLMMVLPLNSPRSVEFHDLQQILADDSTYQQLKSFPGPLVKGRTHKNSVLQICQKRQRIQEDEEAEIEDYDSYVLLWKLMIRLLRQNGQIEGSDIADILLEDKMPSYYSSDNQLVAKSTNDKFPNRSQSSDNIAHSSAACIDEATEQFRQLLLFGNKLDALEYAMKTNLWGHALFLASNMGSKSQTRVLTRFANSLAHNDPLQTLYQLMSNRQPAAVTGIAEESWGDWRPHLAMILANPTCTPLDRASIITLAETLFAKRQLFATHFCYLMVQEFGSYSNKCGKVILIGSNNLLPFKQFASLEAIQWTEIYEYVLSLGSSDYLVHFMPYKLIYAATLIDYGMVSEAFSYLEILAESCNNYFILSLVYELANKIRCHDPTMEAEDVAWLDLLWTKLFSSSNESELNSNSEVGSLHPMDEFSPMEPPPTENQSPLLSPQEPTKQPMPEMIHSTNLQSESPNVADVSPEIPPVQKTEPSFSPEPISMEPPLVDSWNQPPPPPVSQWNQPAPPPAVQNNPPPPPQWNQSAPPSTLQSNPPSPPPSNAAPPPLPSKPSPPVKRTKSADTKKKPPANATTSWLGGLLGKLLPKQPNQAKLPDDTMNIVWDATKNRWIDTTADEDDTDGLNAASQDKLKQAIQEKAAPLGAGKLSYSLKNRPRTNYYAALSNTKSDISVSTPSSFPPLEPPPMPPQLPVAPPTSAAPITDPTNFDYSRYTTRSLVDDPFNKC